MALRNDLSAEVKADLVGYNGASDGTAYIVLGNTVRGDSAPRIYYYDSTSVATTDGEDVLDATGMGAGKFVKAKAAKNYSGTTDASGNYTVTFATPYAVAPNVQASIPNQSATNQYIRVTSVSTTGFTVNAYAFNTNNLLGIISLVTTTSNIASMAVDVLVTAK